MKKQNTEIKKLLKQKQEICARLLQKMAEQMDAVNNQDESRLIAIVEGKEQLITKLNDTDQKIIEIVRDLDEVARESLARKNGELGTRIESDLGKIIEQETVCQEKLNLQKSEVVEKIKG